MAQQHNHLSGYDASEGALYVLFALVLALHPRSPRLFAIENPAQTMHLRLARATLRLFCQQILKAKRDYDRMASKIAAAWRTVRRVCTQAERFAQDVSDSLI